MELRMEASEFMKKVHELEMEQQGAIRARESLERGIREITERNEFNQEAVRIGTGAIEILREVSDEAVSEAYRFLEQSLNSALERMFTNTTRRIKIHEWTRGNQYPQLELELYVQNGKTRSLKSNSGHGIAQIVSLLSILSLIVLTGSRRILVLDEILSGISKTNRVIIEDILWTFTEIGFQFVMNEHGFVPKGSKVYHLEMIGDVSRVKDTYIEDKGVYLDRSEEDVENVGVSVVTTAEDSEILSI